MNAIRGEVFRADCALASRGAPRSPVASIVAKARRVVTKPISATRSVAVAALHGQLLAGADRAELRPERLVHLRLGESGVAGLGEELADLAEVVVQLGRLGHPLVETVEIILGSEGGSHEPGRLPETARAERPHRRLPELGRDARRGQLAAP